jgi:hypothetical protein
MLEKPRESVWPHTRRHAQSDLATQGNLQLSNYGHEEKKVTELEFWKPMALALYSPIIFCMKYAKSLTACSSLITSVKWFEISETHS